MLRYESPPLLRVLFTLIYPTPGISDTFYEEQTWLDKPGLTVYIYIYIIQSNLFTTTPLVPLQVIVITQV